MQVSTITSVPATRLPGLLASAVAAAAALLPATDSTAAFTQFVVTAANTATSGVSLIRYQVFARFEGATDTVLECYNFSAIANECGGTVENQYGGFWHKDNSDYSGGILNQQYGSWDPLITGGATYNRPYDSYLTIGDVANSLNTTESNAAWLTGGTAPHAGDARGWNRCDLVNNGLIGWYDANPADLQGRVGVGANTATDVMIGQFMLSANELPRTYTLSIVWNDGAGGANTISSGQFELGACPTPGVMAVFALAGAAGRRRRR